MRELLRELTALCAPCGFEHEAVRYLIKRFQDSGLECRADGLGNVFAVKQGHHPGPTLLVSAHMDEVGFIVKKIQSDGLLRFEKLGGHDDRVLPAQRVTVCTGQGKRTGVIGTLSAHMMKYDDPGLVRKHSQMYIDVGARSAEEVRALGIEVGDPITWATQYEEFGHHQAIGKGFDDRAGCAVLIKALEELDDGAFNGTLVGVFSVQEEVGLRGARVAAQQVHADVALAVDTTAVSDTPEPMMDDTLRLGGGPGIKVMDFSLIASVPVRKKLEQLAKEKDMPYQLEVFPGIGTDAGELHKEKSGVPTGVISIPSRYAHTAVEVIDLRDLEAAKDLLVAFVRALQPDETFGFI